MTRILCIVFLSVLTTSAQSEIKLQTYVHLSAMDNIIATERVQGSRSHSYKIAVYNGRMSSDRPFPRGLYVDEAWYALLKDSLRWEWKPEGHHFVYSDNCFWAELGRVESVPCSGEVHVQDNDVRRVTQTLRPGKGYLYPTVRMVIDYDWVQLGERRLLPARMTLEGGNERLSISWLNYREFRTTSELVEIDGDDGFVAPVGKIVRAVQKPEIKSAEVSLPIRSINFVPKMESAIQKVKKRWWRFFVVRVKR